MLINNSEFSLSGVQNNQGDHYKFNLNESIVYAKWNKFNKSDLIKTLEEFDSKKLIKKSELNKLSFVELYQVVLSKIIILFKGIIALLSKLTIISFIFRFFSRIKWVKTIWVLFNSFLTFIFGLAYVDVYGFSDIIEGFKNYIEYIKNSKFYSLLIKIFKTTKDINKPEISTEDLKETNSHENFSSGSTENKKVQTRDVKNIEWNYRNSEEINKPFYQTWYFWISISIISASLCYYYWDNLSDITKELIEKIKSLKPDNPDNSANIEKEVSKDIFDKVYKGKSIDLSQGTEVNLPEPQSVVNEGSSTIIDKSNPTKIDITLEEYALAMKEYFTDVESVEKNITKINELTSNNNLTISDMQSLNIYYQNLKLYYNEIIDFYNYYSNMEINGSQIMDIKSKANVFEQTSKILYCLKEQYQVIPVEYQIDLTNLHVFNIDEETVKLADEAISKIDNIENISDTSSSSSNETIKGFKRGFLKGKNI